MRHLAGDVRGSLAPIFALSVFCILALVGATVALGMDGKAANNLQASADSAALAGATAFINAASPKAEDRKNEAVRLATAAANTNADYALTRMDVGQIVEDPYGQHTKIQVDLSFEPANPAAKMAGRNANITIHRSATASAVWGFPLCILALSETGAGLNVSGEIELLAENCVIWANSKASQSMSFTGGRSETKFFCAGGDVRNSSGARVTPRPHEDCETIPDPLEDWVPPAAGTPIIVPGNSPADPHTYDQEALIEQVENTLRELRLSGLLGGGGGSGDPMNGGQTGGPLSAVRNISALGGGAGGGLIGNIFDSLGQFLQGEAQGLTLEEAMQIVGLVDNVDPASYAGDTYANAPTEVLRPNTYRGLDIAHGHVSFMPGVYHIVDAPLIVRRRATLSGEGVTIIFHGDYATFNVLDEARLTLSAPTEGVTSGIVLAEDRYERLSSSAPLRSRMTGSGKVDAIGTVYLPRQKLSITGSGAADQSSPLLQIVADTIELAENGGLKIKIDTEKTDVPMRIQPERTARLDR